MNQLTATGPIRIHRDARGNTHVIADTSPAGYGGAFRVTLSGARRVRVGSGSIEGILLEGADLRCDSGPDAELRSWVFLRYQVDLQTGLAVPGAEDTATLIHGPDLRAVFSNGVSPDDGTGAGHLPLAMLVWKNSRSIRRVVRNVYFHQRHSFVPATRERRAFHIFHPAA